LPTCRPEATNLAKSQCNSKVEVGGIVDMVLLEGGFLFVGLHVSKEGDGLIKVWNTATGAEQSLSGPKVKLRACPAHTYVGTHLHGPHLATLCKRLQQGLRSCQLHAVLLLLAALSMLQQSPPVTWTQEHYVHDIVTLPMQGHILSLLAVNGMLFSGSNDSCIHVWKYDPATGVFNPAVRLFRGRPAVPTCERSHAVVALLFRCAHAVLSTASVLIGRLP
jgi:WD40 repeat protein